MGNKTYEQEFALEMSVANQGKAKNTPWGSGYRAAPEILHGYTKKVKGKTAEERLDMRAGEDRVVSVVVDVSVAGCASCMRRVHHR
jgi:hypothetical protein